MRMIAVDMDGTLLGADGQVSARNLAALKAAEAAGVEVVVATGRRHCYAMRQLRGLGLGEENGLISSNGTVVRTIGARLLERTFLPTATARWLCGHVEEFRNSLVMTFDRVGPDGEDDRGALVVEELEELHGSIGKWMVANEPYIAHVNPIERALEGLPSSVKGQLPNLAKAAQEPAEEAEMLLVRSIEWTVVESETYDTALEQANVILRYLLGARILPYLPSPVANAQTCREQLAGGSTWRACSWICFRLNWRRLAYLRSARQSIWITVISSSRGRRLSG